MHVCRGPSLRGLLMRFPLAPRLRNGAAEERGYRRLRKLLLPHSSALSGSEIKLSSLTASRSESFVTLTVKLFLNVSHCCLCFLLKTNRLIPYLCDDLVFSHLCPLPCALPRSRLRRENCKERIEVQQLRHFVPRSLYYDFGCLHHRVSQHC